MTFAAGLACSGMRPVAAIYSTFLQRAYDQIVHDVCIQNLPVVFALDRAGLVGDDGKTHQGIFDLSYLRCLPNMTIMAPADENEFQHMVATAIAHEAARRRALSARQWCRRGDGPRAGAAADRQGRGRARRARHRADRGGTILSLAEAAARLPPKGIEATVINARSVKPLDEALILDAARRTGHVITIEENVIKGGFGAGVLELFAREGLTIPVRRLGVPDEMIPHGSQTKQREWCGLTADACWPNSRVNVGSPGAGDLRYTRSDFPR